MARIVIEDGKRVGTSVEVGEEKLSVGRLASCELSIDEPQASRKHFLVERRGEAVWVKDLGSKNGTYLNEERIEGEARLKDGDRLRVGTTVLAFQVSPPRVPRRSLEELLLQGSVAPALALSVGQKVAEALAALHEKGKIHGRLTPGAVLVADSGELELEERDSKLARFDPKAPDVLIEAACAAPEEARGLDAGPESDVYALGCILYRALSGAPPYEGELALLLRGHASEASVAPLSDRCVVDSDVDDLVSRMLSKKVSARPVADKVAAALAPLAARALKAAGREAARRKEAPAPPPRPARAPEPDTDTPARAPGEPAAPPPKLTTPSAPGTPVEPPPAPVAAAPVAASAPAAPDAALEPEAPVAPRWKPFAPVKALLLGVGIFLLFVIASQGTRIALRVFSK